MLEKPLFPTMFYETEVPKDLCLSVLDEIKQKQDMINTVSEATQIHPVSDYATDFVHSIHIETFWDQVIPFLQNEWQKYGVMMVNVNSWVSCYTGPAGHHPLHNHKQGFDGRMHYSAILYLTSIGMTDFFTVDVSAKDSMHCHQSSLGSCLFFPAIVPHQYRSEHYDGNPRYTLPFNCELVNLT